MQNVRTRVEDGPRRVAVAQFAPVALDPARNAEAVVGLIAAAADDGAELVVLPEFANTGAIDPPDPDHMIRFWESTEHRDGDFQQTIRNAAQTHNVHVVIGVVERHAVLHGVLTNTAMLATPEGTAHYRNKVHLPRFEKHYFASGDDLSPIMTGIGTLGLLVCADNSFPESARLLALRGAHILAIPHAARRPKNSTLYQSLAVARAYENQLFVLSANRVGSHRNDTFGGGSAIAGPSGVVIAAMNSEAGFVCADIDMTELLRERLRQTRFRDRRPRLYRGLADPPT